MEHKHLEGKTEKELRMKANSMKRRGFTEDSGIIMVRGDNGRVKKYVQHFTRVKKGEVNRFDFS